MEPESNRWRLHSRGPKNESDIVDASSQKWWWPRKRARGNSNGSSANDDAAEVLHLPNFVSDASKLLEVLDAKEGKKTHMREPIIEELVGARIDSLSGLFAPRWPNNSNDRFAMKPRATELTDQELEDWVLKGACSEAFLLKKQENEHEQNSGVGGDASVTNGEKSNHSPGIIPPTNHQGGSMDQISQQYQSHRKEMRNMADKLVASRRRQNFGRGLDLDHILQLGDPPPEFLMRHTTEGDNTPTQDNVRIDRYGRLVYGRQEQMNAREEGGQVDGNDQAQELELEDASDTFWRHHAAAKERRRDESMGIQRSRLMRPDPPVVVAPQPPQPLPMIANQQPMRLGEVCEQMDRDASDAIQRALERYRTEEELLNRRQNVTREGANQLEYELVHIPVTLDEVEPHGFSFFGRDRDRNQAMDEAGGANANNQNGNRRGQRNRQGAVVVNGGERQPDNMQLAFRRICYAVLAVVVSFFFVMMIIPLEMIGDDMSLFVVDEEWLSGLMGPHFEGHHRRSSSGAYVHEPRPEDDDNQDEDPLPFAIFGSKEDIGEAIANLQLDRYVSSDSNYEIDMEDMETFFQQVLTQSNDFINWEQDHAIKEDSACVDGSEMGICR